MITFITCCVCKENKPIEEFYNFSRSKHGKLYRCISCCRAYSKEHRKKRLKQNKNNQLNWYYNITLDDYNKIFEDQKGCCAICGKHQSLLTKSLAVDHNHDTNKVRGLLCPSCNMGIGRFKENISFLIKAANYLTVHKHD